MFLKCPLTIATGQNIRKKGVLIRHCPHFIISSCFSNVIHVIWGKQCHNFQIDWYFIRWISEVCLEFALNFIAHVTFIFGNCTQLLKKKNRNSNRWWKCNMRHRMFMDLKFMQNTIGYHFLELNFSMTSSAISNESINCFFRLNNWKWNVCKSCIDSIASV